MAGIDGVGRVGIRSYVAPVSLSSIITNGLIFNLDASNPLSYSGTGTTWTDLTGSGTIATLTNGTSYSSENGGTLVFDGINDYVSINSGSGLNIGNTYTFSIWVKFNSFNTVLAGSSDFTDSGYPMYVSDSNSMYIAVGQTYTGMSGANLATNQWVCLTVARSGSSVIWYKNGVSIGSGSLGTAASNVVKGIGAYHGAGFPLNGKISSVNAYNRVLSASEVLQNFDGTKSRFGFANSYTTRTSAFAAATGITDATILNALNTFDTGLISNGLDTKMKALYPFVGGTANTHKFNFMDARDTDAAFRLQFNGGGVHSSTGYKPNGTNAYGNTFYNQTTQGDSVNSGHLSYYSRTNSNGAEVEIGTEVNSVAYNLLEIRTAGNTYFLMNQTSFSAFADSDSLGFYVGNRTSSNVINGWKNGVKKVNSNVASTSIANKPIYLAGINSASALLSSTKECAFASIGNGLTDVEATTFSTLVQAMQTALSRQV